MATTMTYTAKLIDGPLEGKTIATGFLDSGDARPRLEISAPAGSKHYLYVRASGTEPVIRVMGEGEDKLFIEEVVDGIVDALSKVAA